MKRLYRLSGKLNSLERQSRSNKRKKILHDISFNSNGNDCEGLDRLLDGEMADFWHWDIALGKFYFNLYKKVEKNVHSISDLESLLCCWIKDGVLHKDDFNIVLSAFSKNLSVLLPFRCCFRKLSGLKSQWWHLEGRYSHDVKGVPVTCHLVVIRADRPIKAFHSQREKLRRNEEIFRYSQSVAWVWLVRSQSMFGEDRCWSLLGFDDTPKTREKSDVRWMKRIHAGDRLRFSSLLRQSLEMHDQADYLSNSSSRSIRYRIRHKEGRWCWLETHMFPYLHKGESLLVGYHRNIDALMKTQIENEKELRQLKKSLTDKTRFLSEFAHELASPMQAIVGFAELCQRDSRLSEIQLQNLNDMQESGQNLLRIVKSVLFTVKLQQGALVWSRQPVLIHKLIKEWQADLAAWDQLPVIDTSTIEKNVFASLGLWGDFLRTRQVLRGLSVYLSYFSKGDGDILLAVSVSRISLPSQLTSPLLALSLYCHVDEPIEKEQEEQWHSPFKFLPNKFQKKLPFAGCNLHTLKTLITTTGGHLEAIISDQGFIGYRCQWPLMEEKEKQWIAEPPINRNLRGERLDYPLEKKFSFTLPNCTNYHVESSGEFTEGCRWEELIGVTQLHPLPSALWVNMRSISPDETIRPSLSWQDKGNPKTHSQEMVCQWFTADDPLSAIYLSRARPMSALIFQWEAWCHNSWIMPDEWLAVIASDQGLAKVPLISLVEDEEPTLKQLESVIQRSVSLLGSYEGLGSYEITGSGESEFVSSGMQGEEKVKLFVLKNPVQAGAWQRLTREIY